MAKKIRWPSESELKSIRKKLSRGRWTRFIRKEDLSIVDKTKYEICKQLIVYANSNRLTQREMAKLIGENESLVSKVLHYYFDEFTIDRLLKFLNKVYPKAEIKIKNAS